MIYILGMEKRMKYPEIEWNKTVNGKCIYLYKMAKEKLQNEKLKLRTKAKK